MLRIEPGAPECRVYETDLLSYFTAHPMPYFGGSLEVLPSSAQDLFMALCSGVAPGLGDLI